MDVIQMFNLNLLDYHGQSYRNGGDNMAGNAKMLPAFNETYFAETLCLVLSVNRQSWVISVTFFGVVNRLYTLFYFIGRYNSRMQSFL